MLWEEDEIFSIWSQALLWYKSPFHRKKTVIVEGSNQISIGNFLFSVYWIVREILFHGKSFVKTEVPCLSNWEEQWKSRTLFWFMNYWNMKQEVKSAVDFLANILNNRAVSDERVNIFNSTLQELLCRHYMNHWFPEKPFKGSGYRCIRINHTLDPLIKNAGQTCGLTESEMCSLFPKELTMWIDPSEVSYRIGENGSIGVLLNEPQPQQQCRQVQQPQQKHQSLGLHSSFDQALSLLSCKDSLNVSKEIESLNLNKLAAFVYSWSKQDIPQCLSIPLICKYGGSWYRLIFVIWTTKK